MDLNTEGLGWAFLTIFQVMTVLLSPVPNWFPPVQMPESPLLSFIVAKGLIIPLHLQSLLGKTLVWSSIGQASFEWMSCQLFFSWQFYILGVFWFFIIENFKVNKREENRIVNSYIPITPIWQLLIYGQSC